MLRFIEIVCNKIEIKKASCGNKIKINICAAQYLSILKGFGQLDNLLRVHWIFEYWQTGYTYRAFKS